MAADDFPGEDGPGAFHRGADVVLGWSKDRRLVLSLVISMPALRGYREPDFYQQGDTRSPEFRQALACVSHVIFGNDGSLHSKVIGLDPSGWPKHRRKYAIDTD